MPYTIGCVSDGQERNTDVYTSPTPVIHPPERVYSPNISQIYYIYILLRARAKYGMIAKVAIHLYISRTGYVSVYDKKCNDGARVLRGAYPVTRICN